MRDAAEGVREAEQLIRWVSSVWAVPEWRIEMEERFTENAALALRDARIVAYNLAHSYVGTEHLLIGLIHAPGAAGKVMKENGVDEQKIIELVNQLIAPNTVIELGEYENFTPRAKRVLQQSAQEAVARKAARIGTEHILIALLKESDCIAVRLLNTLGVNIQKIYVDLGIELEEWYLLRRAE